MKNLDSRAVLVELNISLWTGRILDKKVSEEVDAAKSTKTRAGAYHKRLMAGVDSLHEIESYAAEIRKYHYRMTLPWSDNGPRLLPSEALLEYIDGMKEKREVFERKVKAFVDEYDTQISAMAFKLGDLFNRSEYPTREQIERKFRIDYVLSPVPAAGDFRIDVGTEALEELKADYEKASEDRVAKATASMFEEVYDTLLHTVERLGEKDGKPNIFRDSLVTNLQELIVRLKRLNLTGDERLEEMRQELASLMAGVEPEELRKNQHVRNDVRTNMQAILSKMGMGV